MFKLKQTGISFRVKTNKLKYLLIAKLIKSLKDCSKQPGWPSGYGAGLLIPFPHGFPGSNPGPGAYTFCLILWDSFCVSECMPSEYKFVKLSRRYTSFI